MNSAFSFHFLAELKHLKIIDFVSRHVDVHHQPGDQPGPEHGPPVSGRRALQQAGGVEAAAAREPWGRAEAGAVAARHQLVRYGTPHTLERLTRIRAVSLCPALRWERCYAARVAIYLQLDYLFILSVRPFRNICLPCSSVLSFGTQRALMDVNKVLLSVTEDGKHARVCNPNLGVE